MEINEANKNYSDGLSENDITTQDKINFSLELAESLSRKWESRCNLLDLVLERIKTKDCTLDNVKQMLSQNYIRKCELEGKLFVIRPPKSMSISNLTKDPEELEKAYVIGRETMEKRLDDLRKYLG